MTNYCIRATSINYHYLVCIPLKRILQVSLIVIKNEPFLSIFMAIESSDQRIVIYAFKYKLLVTYYIIISNLVKNILPY